MLMVSPVTVLRTRLLTSIGITDFEFLDLTLLKYSTLAEWFCLVSLYGVKGGFIIICAKLYVNQFISATDIFENMILTVRAPVSTGDQNALEAWQLMCLLYWRPVFKCLYECMYSYVLECMYSYVRYVHATDRKTYLKTWSTAARLITTNVFCANAWW